MRINSREIAMLPSEQSASHRGFTLVELLVAAALCVIIMYVMATAFKAGTDTLSQLKSVASLAEQLRTADTIMRRDLSAVHLEQDPSGPPLPAPVLVSSRTTPAWVTPNRGFFKLAAPSPVKVYHPTNPPSTTVTNDANYGYIDEGAENGISSFRATDQWMHFTCLTPVGPSNQLNTFAAICPDKVRNDADPGSTNSLDGSNQRFVGRAAEVLYFLAPAASNPQTSPDVQPVLNLYTLHRRIRVLAATTMPPTYEVTPADVPGGIAAFPEMALFDTATPGVSVRRSQDLCDPANFTNRLVGNVNTNPRSVAGAMFSTGSAYYGNDIVLTNVISMHIQVLMNNSYYEDITGGLMDTTLGTTNPIRAVRVSLRVYDPKNRLTRQLTLIEDL